jgi:glycosyltransferase involved in cell wall biosynthesis
LEAKDGLMNAKPIKVVYLMDHYAHPYGGTERQALELIRHLDRDRFHPRVAVFRPSEYLKVHDFDCPVDVLGIGKMANKGSIATLFRYARDLRRNGFSLVHVFFNDASLIGPPIMKWNGLRVIVSRRDMGFWYSAAKTLVLRANRLFVDRVVANSEAVKRSVRGSEGYSERKVSVIYNGYERAWRTTKAARRRVRESLGISDDAIIVGIVANLRPIKRIQDVIKAFAQVVTTEPNACLVIVGDGDLYRDLEELATSLRMRDRVVFAGRLPDPIPVINEFAVAVLCSESEGFSNSIIEYMNCAKPTVCTNVGGNPEMIRDGENGFLVPVGDVGGLAERIGRLVRDPPLAERLGRNAQAEARDKYGMSKMVQAHMELYESICVGAGRAQWRLSRQPRPFSNLAADQDRAQMEMREIHRR